MAEPGINDILNQDPSTLQEAQFSHTITVIGYEIGPKSVVKFTRPPDKINKCCMAAKFLGLFMFLRIIELSIGCTWAVVSFMNLEFDYAYDAFSKDTKGSSDWFFIPQDLYHFNARSDYFYYAILGAYISDLTICLVFSLSCLSSEDIKCLLWILSAWLMFQVIFLAVYTWGLVEFILSRDYLHVYYVDVALCFITIFLLIINIVALCRLQDMGYESFNDRYQVELRQMYHEQMTLQEMGAVPSSMTDTSGMMPQEQPMMPRMTMMAEEPPIQLHLLPDGNPDPNYPYHAPDGYHQSEYHYHHYHQEDVDGWRNMVKPDLSSFMSGQQGGQHTTTVVVKNKKHHKHHRKKPKEHKHKHKHKH